MKKILALAIASAFAAPAFAATANVDVYGKLHMSFSQFDDQEAGVKDQQFTSNPSRIGFKGAEDLGGGLAAIWQIESTVNMDESGGGFATRNSFFGLKSDAMGTVIFGRHDTPLKLLGSPVDLFRDTLADSRNVLGGGSDDRPSNMAQYTTPSFGGLTFAGLYSTDPKGSGTAGDAAGTSLYNLSAAYNNGPLFLGLGYGDGDYHEERGFGKHMRAAAGFTMGNLKFVGQYDKLDDDNTVRPDFQAGDYDAWMLGAAFTMGNIVLKANYMDGEYDDAATGYDTNQWTIGADYNLSKRTSLYALYANGENITFGSGAGSSDYVGGVGGAAGAGGGAVVTAVDGVGGANGDVSLVAVGMIHSF